jgi:hypothetical protein
LSLIGDVTNSKETAVESKLAKHRGFAGESGRGDGHGSERAKEVKVPTASEKRRKDKNRALVGCVVVVVN